MAANRSRLRLRTRAENRAASSTARTKSETAALRISRLSAMVPPPILHGATDADSKGIIAPDGGTCTLPAQSPQIQILQSAHLLNKLAPLRSRPFILQLPMDFDESLLNGHRFRGLALLAHPVLLFICNQVKNGRIHVVQIANFMPIRGMPDIKGLRIPSEDKWDHIEVVHHCLNELVCCLSPVARPI